MKALRLSKITITAFCACGVTAFAQAVNVAQLPAPVQSVIQTETKNGPVNSVQQLNLNGHVVYQVGFQQGGSEKNIYLNPDGSYYQNTAGASNPSATNRMGRTGRAQEVKIETLPQNVQN